MSASAILLGRPRLHCSGNDFMFVPERRCQVLAVLAMHGDWMHRDQLAALFWPDQPDASARANVRKVLFRIRESIPGAQLDIRGADVRWQVASDVKTLLDASAGGRWSEVVEAYTGPLLAGLDDPAHPAYEAWLERERQRLFEHARAAYRALTEQASAAGDTVTARRHAARLLELDPLDESAVAAWCTASLALGAAAAAEHRYAEYTRQLASDLGVAPSDRLRSLAQRWAASPAVAPSRATAAPLDRFIGRRQEIAELNALLARPECRLLAIVGAGGVGKSRLLREALPDLERGLGLPALWLPLGDLATTSELPARLAVALQRPVVQRGTLAEQLAALLGEQPRLLAFDNAEHLGELGGLLAAVAGALPRLRIVVTSRARLGVFGEWVLPVGGLPVPDADSGDAEAATAFDAVGLFIDRAGQQHQTFSSADIGAIVEIVRHVDGMPLAIELAAAWTRLLPPATIAAEIAASIDLLANADGSVALRKIIEGSCELLAPRERATLAALSVFAGGFTPTMARLVCDAPLPVLAVLADKSLLGSDQDGRLRLHPLVQQVMEEAASGQPGWAELQIRHAQSYAAWLGETIPALRSAPQQTATLVAVEHANCRAALRRAVSAGQGDLARPIALALTLTCEIQGRLREGAALFEDILGTAASPACGGPLLHGLATLRYRQGDLDATRRHGSAGLRMARLARDRPLFYRCINVLGLACNTGGDHEQALRHFAPGVRRLRRSNDVPALSAFLTGQGIALKCLGRLDEAAAVYEDVLAIERSGSDLRGMINQLNNIGNLHRSRRDYQRALTFLDEGLDLAERHGAEHQRIFLALNRGLALMELDRLQESAPVLERVLERCRDEPRAQAEVAALQGLGLIALRRGQLQTARQHLARASRLALDSAMAKSFAQTMIYVAELSLAAGDRDRGRAQLVWAMAQPLDYADVCRSHDVAASIGMADTDRAAAVRVAAGFDAGDWLSQLEAEVGRSPPA